MSRLSVIVPGKLKHPGAQAFTDDYGRRIARICEIDRITVKERKRRGRGRRAQEKEAADLLAAVPTGAVLIALDAGGRKHDSNSFLLWLVGLLESGANHLVFAIGGPEGHTPGVLDAARHTISLSPMTLPHELAEVVLMEQLYRALTRWKGFPYHR